MVSPHFLTPPPSPSELYPPLGLTPPNLHYRTIQKPSQVMPRTVSCTNSTTISSKTSQSVFTWNALFLEHTDVKIKKATAGINLMHNLNLSLPHSSLLTVCKCFIKPHLDYGDVIYNQPNLSFLANQIKSVQCNVTLTIMGTNRGTSTEKLYQALGFESLKDRRWLMCLCYLYKIASTKQPAYLNDLILPFQRSS